MKKDATKRIIVFVIVVFAEDAVGKICWSFETNRYSVFIRVRS